jgi:hypothetical protein
MAPNRCLKILTCGALYRAAVVQSLGEKPPIREPNRLKSTGRGAEVLAKTTPTTAAYWAGEGSGESRPVGAVAEGVELGSNILHVDERNTAHLSAWRRGSLLRIRTCRLCRG